MSSKKSLHVSYKITTLHTYYLSQILADQLDNPMYFNQGGQIMPT